MYCCNCGKELGDGDRFCDDCGTPVYEETGEGAEGQEDEHETETDADGPDETEAPVLNQESGFTETYEPESELSPGAGTVLSDLEKKIMKNMEDELILEMPETAGQGQPYGSTLAPPYARPPYESSQKQPPYGNSQVLPQDLPGNQGVERTACRGKKADRQPQKKKKKMFIIGLSCVVAALVAAVVFFFFLLFSPEKKLKECVEDRDWTAASALYKDNFKENEKKKEKADEILRNAVDVLKEEFIAGTIDYATVKRHLRGIEDFWDDSYVKDTLDFIRELGDSREAFEEAGRHMLQEEYEDAIRLYGEVISSDANYETAKEKLEAAKSAYREKILGESKAYAQMKDYDSAIAVVEKGLEILAGDTVFKSRLEELQREQEEYGIEEVLTEAENYAAQNNYFEAMDTVRQGLLEKQGNDELEAALEDYSEKYEKDILAKAEAAVGTDENYEAAILIFDSALNTLGGDYAKIEQAIREKREEYVQLQLDKSQKENAESAIVGVWQGTTVSSEGLEFSMEQFLAAGGMAGSSALINCQPSGSFHMELLGVVTDGNWQRDEAGSGVYYLNVGGDRQPVRIDTSGRLHMDLNGIDIVFEKTEEA